MWIMNNNSKAVKKWRREKKEWKKEHKRQKTFIHSTQNKIWWHVCSVTRNTTNPSSHSATIKMKSSQSHKLWLHLTQSEMATTWSLHTHKKCWALTVCNYTFKYIVEFHSDSKTSMLTDVQTRCTFFYHSTLTPTTSWKCSLSPSLPPSLQDIKDSSWQSG